MLTKKQTTLDLELSKYIGDELITKIDPAKWLSESLKNFIESYREQSSIEKYFSIDAE